MTLEAKCRELVRKWSRAGAYMTVDAWHCAYQLSDILPKRPPKKRKKIVRYGPPPSGLLARKKRRKDAPIIAGGRNCPCHQSKRKAKK